VRNFHAPFFLQALYKFKSFIIEASVFVELFLGLTIFFDQCLHFFSSFIRIEHGTQVLSFIFIVHFLDHLVCLLHLLILLIKNTGIFLCRSCVNGAQLMLLTLIGFINTPSLLVLLDGNLQLKRVVNFFSHNTSPLLWLVLLMLLHDDLFFATR